jgi:excinuclease UvrABC helicase subunit UvrB
MQGQQQLQSFLQDNLANRYDEILLHPDDNFIIPENFVEIIDTAISESAAANTDIIALKNIDLLYLMEFRRIYKVGGVSSFYAIMEWPGFKFLKLSPPCSRR